MDQSSDFTSPSTLRQHGNLTTRIPIIPVKGVPLQRSGNAGRGSAPESARITADGYQELRPPGRKAKTVNWQ